MKKIFLFSCCIAFYFSVTGCIAQTGATISKPQIELIENYLAIHYDILNSDPSDKYSISLAVRDAKGKQINAQTLQGDIGKNISGGRGKEITWDLTLDSIYMEATLFFKVNAEVLPSILANDKNIQAAIPKTIEPGEDTKQKPEAERTAETSEVYTETMNIKRGGVVFSSLLFPGTGLTKINKGHPHWLKGVVAYGCIGTSLISYSSAQKNFANYQDARVSDYRDNYLTTANKQVALTNTLLISAISIWAIDFIWTITGSKDLKKPAPKNLSTQILLQPYSGDDTFAPVLSFNYRF
jgi:hypothetical protein